MITGTEALRLSLRLSPTLDLPGSAFSVLMITDMMDMLSGLGFTNRTLCTGIAPPFRTVKALSGIGLGGCDASRLLQFVYCLLYFAAAGRSLFFEFRFVNVFPLVL